MKTKEHYSFQFLGLNYSQNRMTARHQFSIFLYTLFCCRGYQSYIGGIGRGFFNLNNHTMKQNISNWRQRVSISKLPKMLLFGILLATSSVTFAQTTPATTTPMARMMLDNSVTVRTGLNGTYKIPVGHFGFTTIQEAAAYFQARDIDYIDFIVVDLNTVLMQFDLTNAAVANWTLNDWMTALDNRAASVLPRTLPNN